MGSINSRAKAPAVQPYVPVTPSVTAVEPSEPVKTEAQLAAASRTDSLLRRSRGRLGTILTGFRGFLSASEKAENNQRKTLLGE